MDPSKHKRALIGVPIFRTFNPFVCCVSDGDDDDPGGGGDDDDPPEKTFTQSEVSKMMAKHERKLAKKYGDIDEIKAKADRVDELTEEMQELKDQLELKDKDSAEQKQILADRARKQADKEIGDMKAKVESLTGERDKAVSSLRDHVVRGHATEALAKAGVLPTASRHAIRAFLEDAKIELDDEHNVTSIEYGEVPQKDMVAAATAFLGENDVFKAAKAGGSGTRHPTAGGPGVDRDSLSGAELAARGWAQPPVEGGKTDLERQLDGG